MTNHTHTATGIDLDKLQRFNMRSGLMNPEPWGLYVRFQEVQEQARRAEQTATGTGERFFMDHGLWHDRLTGQHLFTQDQYDEQWRDMYRAGQEDAAIGHNMLGGGALKRTATGTGATHEQLSTNPDTLSTNQAALSGNLDAGTGDADERALPVGVCWSEQRCDFYKADTGASMGSVFYGRWRDRADEFPTRDSARAALAKQAAAPAEQSGGDSEREFIVVDDDLQAFLDAAVDWVRGEPQNMDTGLYMFDLLQRLEDRLAGNTASLVDDAGAQAAVPAEEAMTAGDIELIRVPAPEANSYCRILSILGMEEEGDPVAEVQRLFDTAAAQTDDARDAALGVLIDGYESGFFASSPEDDAGQFTLHYTTEAQAEAAYMAITRLIDAALTAPDAKGTADQDGTA